MPSDRPESSSHSSSSRHRSRREDEDEHRHRRHGHSSSSSHRSKDEHRSRSSHSDRHGHSSSSSSKRHRDDDDSRRSSKQRIIDDDAGLPTASTGASSSAAAARGSQAVLQIPTSASLDLQSHPEPSYSDDPAPLPKDPPTIIQLKRDDWMLAGAPAGSAREDEGGEGAPVSSTSDDSSFDLFSSMGQQRVKKPRVEKPDPEKLHISSRELNSQLVEGKSLDDYTDQPKRQTTFGSPGYQWRMMKLKKTFEQAQEQGRGVEEVALERYGDLATFEEAKAEKRFLDGNRTPGGGISGRSTPLRAFRRPGDTSAPSTPQSEAIPSLGGVTANRFSRQNTSTPQGSKHSTPIPSVFTPTLPRPAPPPQASTPNLESPAADVTKDPAALAAVEASQQRDAISDPPMDAAALNKLEAKVMKAELTGKSNAASLRAKLEREKIRASKGGDQGEGYFSSQPSHEAGSSSNTSIQVLPTLDGHGRLYDVGKSRPGEDQQIASLPGNRRKKDRVETHDVKTGEVVRRNADDDEITLEEMVRQERFKAGADKDFDAELASRIATDGHFKDDFDYLDDNVEKLARKKMKSDALKRQFAVNDFAKTKKALESCRFCWKSSEDGEEERPPLAKMIASGTRAYLALPETEPLVEGHVLIVPIQHHLSMLEGDDDLWDEVRNFMKCLLQQASQRKPEAMGVVFYETVISIKAQRHTCIEALPLPLDLLSALPSHFHQELASVTPEDSQTSRVVSFTTSRPFRRSMTSRLPYFMIQFDYKGEKGYGHVLEGKEEGDVIEAGLTHEDADGYGMSTMSSQASGKFERYFAAEVIGSLLDMEPVKWRKPRRLQGPQADALLKKMKEEFAPFDWTKALRERG